jgi:hypothetical protein
MHQLTQRTNAQDAVAQRALSDLQLEFIVVRMFPKVD